MRPLDDVPRLPSGLGAPRRPLRTLGLIGDVHAEGDRLEVAIATMRDVDRLASVGDVVDGDGDLSRCIALLEAHDVLTVGGNHERFMLAGRLRDLPFSHELADQSDEVARFLSSRPPMIELHTTAGAALLCHGVGRDDMAVIDPRTDDRVARWHAALKELLEAERFAWMLAGHTHQFMLRRFDHLGIVNAGTLSRRLEALVIDGPRLPGFVRIDFSERVVDRWTFAGDGTDVDEPVRHALP